MALEGGVCVCVRVLSLSLSLFLSVYLSLYIYICISYKVYIYREVLLCREDYRPQVQLLEYEAFHGTGGGGVRVC